MLPRYKNVRSLVNVHTLDLHGCNGIKDVSALQSVHTLNLSCCCYTVTDISALGDVHTLKLGGCKGITDISCLRILVMLNSCLQFWVCGGMCFIPGKVKAHYLTLILDLSKYNIYSTLTRHNCLYIIDFINKIC